MRNGCRIIKVKWSLMGVAVLIIGLLLLPDLLIARQTSEWHGSLQTIYYPRKERIYQREENPARDYTNNLWLDGIRGIGNPLVRMLAERDYLKSQRENEGKRRMLQDVYQSFNLAALKVGGEKGTLIMQGRIFSAQAEGQPDWSLRQFYWKYEKLYRFLPEFKVGRVFSARAAGLVNYDGGSMRLALGDFYFIPYGGLLIDNDYLQKDEDRRCRTNPLRTSCLRGNGFRNEDYESKWRAGDVRNISSSERKGDTITGMAFGYAAKKLSLELDYQKKTDAKSTAEEVGGVKFNADPSKSVSIYADARVNLIRGEQNAALAGFSYGSKGWRINPEYEYYKPRFKKNSFWDSFYPVARSAVRLNVYRFLGRKFKMKLSAGRTHFLKDTSKSDELTTNSEVDPITGEVVGRRDPAPQKIPLEPIYLLGYPLTIDPITLQPRIVASRTLSPMEAAVQNSCCKPKPPRNGAEGEAGFTYTTDRFYRIHMSLSTVQGPEGYVHKALLGLGKTYGKLRIRCSVGVARYRDTESDEANDSASFGTLENTYYYSRNSRFSVGLEIFKDRQYASNMRGKFGYRYDF